MTNKPREIFCFYTGEEPFHAFNNLDALSELHNPGNAERYVDAKSYQALLEQAEKMASILREIEANKNANRGDWHRAIDGLKSWQEFKK